MAKEVINFLKSLNETPAFTVLSFIGNIVLLYQIYALIKGNFTRTKQVLLICSVILLGVIFPASSLILSDWHGWIHIFLNIFSIFCLFNFVFLIYIIKKMVAFSTPKRKAMEVSKIRQGTQAMYPQIDFDVALTFYYDETNNVKKLHLKKGDFNVDYTANFVLGGFAYSGLKPDMTDIFDGIALQPNVVEVKLTHLAHGTFPQCLTSRKLKRFLTNLSTKPVYLHISTLNLLYYSLVDIIDSVLPEELYMYAPAFKNALYVACKINLGAIIPLFVKYAYPNVPHESTDEFVDELMNIIAPLKSHPQHGEAIKKLDDLLRQAAAEDNLPFITDEEDHLLIKGLMELYARSIYLFANSTHIFDNEGEIKEKLEEFPMELNGQKLTNYTFLDSKVDKLIQASDVTIGLLGKMFKYINGKTHDEIINEVETMSPLQLENIDLLLDLMRKTIDYNQGLLHYVDAYEETSKVVLIGRLRGKNI